MQDKISSIGRLF